MKRARISTSFWLVTTLFTVLPPQLVKGDGGIVQLHEAQGPFLVTVFVSPEGPRDGLEDVSVLVQARKTGEVVLDADVSLGVDPPNGLAVAPLEPLCGLSPPPPIAFESSGTSQHQATVAATREQALNKLLYAAALNLNAPGNWRLHIFVVRGSENARFDCLLPVTRASGEPSGLWPYLVFPPVVIAAFAMNQRLRKHSLERDFEPRAHSACRA